jgi:HEPN domain-containing protein
MDDSLWDDFIGKRIELPQTSMPKDLLRELSEFVQNALEKENKLMSLTAEVLDELYRQIENDDVAASHIISYVQRRHFWDVELLAERRDVDEMLMARHNIFDEHMWDKVMNTTAISDLHHETFKLSQKYIELAIKEVLAKDGTAEQPAF